MKMEPLSALILALWGIVVAFVQERFGVFDDLSPRTKQLVNAVLAFIVPGLVIYLTPYWKPEFGDANAVVMAAFYILAPAAVWVVGQLAHQVDRLLQLGGDWLKKNVAPESKPMMEKK
jgi:hypothetical protein